MVRYRRNYVPGGMFFFTVTLDDRRSSALVDHVALLRAAFRKTRSEQPFSIDAIVILPDHLHTIMTLPSGDSDFSGRWRRIKSALPAVLSQPARRFHATTGANIRFGKGAFGNTPSAMTAISNAAPTTFISIRSSIDWCHRQPRGPFSSLHRYARAGVLDRDWGGDGRVDGKTDFGERAEFPS
jgi:putative transposase